MPTPSDKKLLILYILDILRNETDEKHPLMHTQIKEKVEAASGISCDRKTVAANIDALNAYYYPKYNEDCIVTAPISPNGKRKGWYLKERTLESGELRYLVDWIYSNKGIPAKYAKALTDKLLEGESTKNKQEFKYTYNTGNIARVENCDVFYNIDLINEAIEQNKKIEFCYLEYNTDKKLVPKLNGKRYVVSPYFMHNSNGRYFLVCKYDGHAGVTNYKIDRMKNVTVLSESRYPETSITGYENGINREEYSNENPLMCGGDRTKTTIRLHKDIVNELVENFGNNVSFYKKDGNLYATVTSSAEAIVTWVFQYGECMEIVEPESQRNAIKALLAQVNEFYKND